MEHQWHKIISYGGSQSYAFEEMVCQIAMGEDDPPYIDFERVGSPDGGVECYCRFADGSEHGWQAKFYDALESSGWSKIKNSLFAAIETHPKLTQYYICLPHNLSDGGRGKKTQKAKWDNYKKTWTKELQNKGRKIKIVLWSSSTILNKLLAGKNVGIRSFFFNEIEIKESQLDIRLDASIDNLGPRYNRDLNFKIDYLPSVFDALTKSQRFKRGFVLKNDKLFKLLETVILDACSIVETKVLGEELGENLNKLRAAFASVNFLPSHDLPVLSFISGLNEISSLIDNLKKEYAQLETIYQKELKGKQTKESDKDDYALGKTRKTAHQTENIYKYEQNAALYIAYLNGPVIRCSNEGVLFLTGEPGMGKSHLLADIALERKKNNVPSIFLLGEQFPDNSPKISLQQFLCPNKTIENYLAALESIGKAKQVRILLIIDAINEGPGKFMWKPSIAGLVKELSQFRWIAFVFSYRSTYKDIVMPENFNPPLVTHNGFDGLEYEATKAFFTYYKIQQPSIPLLHPEFSNPLFLKTFCITLNKAGKTTIPEGYEGISTILNEYLLSVNKNIGERLRYKHKKLNLVLRAVEKLLEWQIKNETSIINWDEGFQLVEVLLKPYTNQTGLLEELISEGLFTEEYAYNHNTHKYDQHGIVFNFERFNEHLKAGYLLSNITSTDKLKEAFKAGGSLHRLFVNKHGFSGMNRGLLNSMAIVIPEKYGVELYEVFTPAGDYGKGSIYDAFLYSMAWRKQSTLQPSSWDYVRPRVNHHETNLLDFLNAILLLAPNPSSYYNAEFLHGLLKDKPVGTRDYMWSIPIDKLWKWYERNAVQRIIDYAWSEEDKKYVSDHSIELLGKTLAWFFTSSNRTIRDKATKAFASLFIDRIPLVQNIIHEFKEVNDPYVLERIIAGTYGAVFHSRNLQDNTVLAQYIYDEFFKKRKPPVNILTRDYCKGIIEYVVYQGGKLNYRKTNLNPPFLYKMPDDIPPASWVETIEIKKDGPYTNEERGQAQIPHSVLHWDFARYVLGTNHGSSIPFTDYSIASRKAYFKLKELLTGYRRKFFDYYVLYSTIINGTGAPAKKIRNIFHGEKLTEELEFCAAVKEDAYKFLQQKLSKPQWKNFLLAQPFIASGFETRHYDKKRFDVKTVQRFILKKVFDLGWTQQFFGEYDAGFSAADRKGDKAERIGKKYQWIAYHEILALLSDNFDVLSRYSDETEPSDTWRHRFRDIDPTILIKYNPPEDDNMDAHWLKEMYQNWYEERTTWLTNIRDLPDFKNIIVTSDDKKEQWYLLYDRIVWKSETEPGKDWHDAARKELWVDLKAVLVDKRTKNLMLKERANQLLWVRDNSDEVRNYYGIFLAELYHADGYLSQIRNQEGNYPYSEFRMTKKILQVIQTTEDFNFSDEYDLSGYKTHIYKPTQFLFNMMQGQPGKNDACIYDKTNKVILYDRGVAENNAERALLVHKPTLDKYLAENNLEIIWFYFGEKEDIGPSISFVYRMSYSGFLGFEKDVFIMNIYHEQDPKK